MFLQDAEKVRQLRSRIVQILNVPQRVRLRSSLAAALLDGLFEHPAGVFCIRSRLAGSGGMAKSRRELEGLNGSLRSRSTLGADLPKE